MELVRSPARCRHRTNATGSLARPKPTRPGKLMPGPLLTLLDGLWPRILDKESKPGRTGPLISVETAPSCISRYSPGEMLIVPIPRSGSSR
jgi:hypothetical protein